MSSTGTSVKMVDPRDLLEVLHQHPLAAPFNLALHTEQHGRKGLLRAIREVCCPLDGGRPCPTECSRSLEESLARTLRENQPAVGSCPQGLLYFVLPLPESKGLPDWLIGGGVFKLDPAIRGSAESPGDTSQVDTSSEARHELQPISIPEAESLAEELFRALPRLLEQKAHALSLTRTTRRLAAVQELSRELAACEGSEQALAIVSEALVVLFDLPKVLIVLQQTGQAMTIHSTLGLAPETFQLDQKRLAEYLEDNPGQPEILTGEALATLFPGLKVSTACLFPLLENSCRLGAIVVLDVDLHARDQALIELLVNRLATRLESLQTAAGHRQERQFSARLIAMISSLALVDSRQELYLQILEMSAELMQATSGSLMLLDETAGTLKITAAKGMTPALARTLSVPYGEGISGRVAKNRFPLLVNDIERDKRVATRNRPRFKTKSFISLPLERDDRLVGVLNLADKSNGANFSEADLNLLQTFTRHAVQMIERVVTLEKAGRFETLAITDPLTGLYNRRYLEDRLQEEFSRSERQQQSFCIVMVDLDSFKIYNDICGHLAGDNALRKTAKLMRCSAREMDIVTRYGGEEFCLILPGTGKKESVLVAERIRRAIENESFPGEHHLPLGRLTASVGIAVYPADGVTANELIHAADLALYHAKSLGRNRLVLYEHGQANQALLAHQS